MAFRIKRILFLLTLVLVLTFGAQGWTEGEKGNDMLVLDQTCAPLQIAATVYVSPQGIRIDNGDVTILSQPPKWNILIINKRGNCYYQSDFRGGLAKLRNTNPVLGEQFGNDQGWVVTKGPLIIDMSTNVWHKTIASASGREPLQCYSLADSTSFAPQCSQLLSTTYGLPCLQDQLPLKFSFVGNTRSFVPVPQRHYDQGDHANSLVEWLATKSSKKMPYRKELFFLPKDCKRTDIISLALTRHEAKELKMNGFIIKDLLKHPDALFNSR
jgi:hypothetical protein